MALGRKRSSKENKPTGDGPDTAKVNDNGGWFYRGKVVGEDETHTGTFHYTDRQGRKQISLNFKRKKD